MILSRPFVCMAACLTWLCGPAELAAQATPGSTRAIENIIVSRQDDMGIIRVLPRCKMRYLVHSPPSGGKLLRVRVTLSSQCREIFDDELSERYSTPGQESGGIRSIEFDSKNRFSATLSIEFNAPREFQVRSGNNGWLEIRHDLSRTADEFANALPEPLNPPVALPQATEKPAVTSLDRSGPSLRKSWVPAPEVYTVQLGVFQDPQPALAAASAVSDQSPAVRSLAVGGNRWQSVFVGPFDELSEAESVHAQLRMRFPDSWVQVSGSFDASGILESAETLGPVAAQSFDGVVVDPERTAELLIDARRAIVAQDYLTADSRARAVLADAGNARRAEARELLAVSLERRNALPEAMSEYQAWLGEFADQTDAARVRARLQGLEQSTATSRDALLDGPVDSVQTESSWRGGISQVYRRDVTQRVDDGNGRLRQSALYNYADVSYQRRGERFDVLARATASYVLDANSNSRRQLDTGWISDAYLRITDRDWNVDGVVGRQRVYGKGVFGRFDGINADYRWREDISFGVVAGAPLDSARYIANRGRFFYGFNAGVRNLWDHLDARVYTQLQTADGLSDREAVGAELSYHGLRTHVVAWFDYDWSYQTLNTLLLSADFQFNERAGINAVVETGKQSIVTTRNALIGQLDQTLDELRGRYTEGQVRTLAVNRTPDATRLSLGGYYALTPDLRLTVDLSQWQQEASVASGGVVAIPDTGQQSQLLVTLLGSSWLTDGDLARLQYRADKTRVSETARVLVEWRYPLAKGLRVSPIIAVANRTWMADQSEQVIIEPSIRVFYRWRERFLLELEAGGRYSNRELAAGVIDPFIADGEEELIGSYINIGYRMEF